MITYAMSRKEEVDKLLLEAYLDRERSKWWAVESYLSPPKVQESSWVYAQLISVHGGSIKGYLSASLDRDAMIVTSLSIVKFCDGHELDFAADLSRILKWLQQHWAAIHWPAVEGSPLVDIYEQLAQLGGGSMTGLSPRRVKLRDGRLVGFHRYYIPGTDNPDGLIHLPAEFDQ
jgi:hypothetical protein